MSRFIRLEVNEAALTEELFAFVTDPRDSRGERDVIQELHEIAPEMVDVLECMVIDGVDRRFYVADYVHAVLREMQA